MSAGRLLYLQREDEVCHVVPDRELHFHPALLLLPVQVKTPSCTGQIFTQHNLPCIVTLHRIQVTLKEHGQTFTRV